MTRGDAKPRLYRYIMTSDDGIAPCIDGGLVTLATCKPVVRRVARPGDWVMGFFGKGSAPGTLVWAARIAEKREPLDYERAYRSRADAVYREGPDGQPVPLRPDYHARQEDRDKDLSAPALIFERAHSWYLGEDARLLPESLVHLAAKGRSHRVNFRRPGDDRDLKEWLAGLGPPGIYGRPRDDEGCAPCARPARRRRREGC